MDSRIYQTKEKHCLWSPYTLIIDNEGCNYLINQESNPTPFKNSVKQVKIVWKDPYSKEFLSCLKLMELYSLSKITFQIPKDIFLGPIHNNEVLINQNNKAFTL